MIPKSISGFLLMISSANNENPHPPATSLHDGIILFIRRTSDTNSG